MSDTTLMTFMSLVDHIGYLPAATLTNAMPTALLTCIWFGLDKASLKQVHHLQPIRSQAVKSSASD